MDVVLWTCFSDDVNVVSAARCGDVLSRLRFFVPSQQQDEREEEEEEEEGRGVVKKKKKTCSSLRRNPWKKSLRDVP